MSSPDVTNDFQFPPARNDQVRGRTLVSGEFRLGKSDGAAKSPIAWFISRMPVMSFPSEES